VEPPALCDECSVPDAILLSPEQAAAVIDIPERLIYQWVEAGAIHYKEARNGKLAVCLKTLISRCRLRPDIDRQE
jgi:hypothetical protein